MSSRDISRAEEGLRKVLRKVLPLHMLTQDAQETVLDEAVDAFKDLAEAVADERIDREFNRGDWRY